MGGGSKFLQHETAGYLVEDFNNIDSQCEWPSYSRHGLSRFEHRLLRLGNPSPTIGRLSVQLQVKKIAGRKENVSNWPFLTEIASVCHRCTSSYSIAPPRRSDWTDIVQSERQYQRDREGKVTAWPKQKTKGKADFELKDTVERDFQNGHSERSRRKEQTSDQKSKTMSMALESTSPGTFFELTSDFSSV